MQIYKDLAVRGLLALVVWALVSNLAGIYVYPTFSISYESGAGNRELGYLVLESLILVIVSGYIGYKIYEKKGSEQEAVLTVLAVLVIYEIINFLVIPLLVGNRIQVVTGSIVASAEVVVASIIAFISFNLKTRME